jgi:hypothetical protein
MPAGIVIANIMLDMVMSINFPIDQLQRAVSALHLTLNEFFKSASDNGPEFLML